MTRRLAGAVASCLALLAGLWLILSPFALGLQPKDVDWTHQTVTDVWSGIGLGVLGLLGMIIFAAALMTNLQERGLAEPRAARRGPAEAADESPAAAPAAPATTPAPSSDLDKLLSPLVAALTEDLQRERENRSPNGEPASWNGDSGRRIGERPAATTHRTEESA
ncbi:hypothetical protein FOE78_22075 [Microlunatus elymi]|uniref:Uncharacterized protein n=1 Tax=Microlunatus elymi TaxID=2596828 RepID=A0A516Q4A4_9ACTN|nr:hypothetical protein [Microlunatus elymi]QDP98234.1 hypothetical protein FOE78_22075 [Microlunatus elymi]